MGFFGGGGASVDLASPPAIGNTTPNTGAFTTLSANNGTITTSSPAFTLAQTWNASAQTFTALRVNVTNTASSSGSLLMDLQVGGTSRARINRSGTITSDSDDGCILSIVGGVAQAAIGQHPLGGGAGVHLSSNRGLNWSSGQITSNSPHLTLIDDAANILAQRRTTNAQTFRLYNTFTSATNFERVNFRWASNEFILDAENGSAGGTLRGVKIGSATTSLLGFYGATPVDQPATVADPTGGGTQDAEARTAINAIIDRLQELGLVAT